MKSFWSALIGLFLLRSIDALPTPGHGEISYGVCVTPTRQQGQCILLKNCKPLFDLLNEMPLTSSNKVFLQKSQCGYKSGEVLVCCPISSVSPPRPPIEDGNKRNSEDAHNMILAESFGDCLTPSKQQGQCIPLNRCTLLNNLLTQRNLTSSIRGFLRRSQCGYHSGQVLVCCSFRSGSPHSAGGANLLPAPGDCGTATIDKVVGGRTTKIDEFPWMALLNYHDQHGNITSQCGGVLINNRYVLTASHCASEQLITKGWRLGSVSLGEWDTNTAMDCEDDDCSPPPMDIPIEEIIIHESYRPATASNLHDIALLRLSTHVTYSAFIKPACLPSAQHLRDATFEDVSFDVAGWGLTENGSWSNVKLKATVKGVDFYDCQAVYRKQWITLYGTQLCAGGEKGVDSCLGDSGGPLLGTDISDKTRPFFFVAGIVSFGPKICGTEGIPGVYTRVGSYIDWIQRRIRP